MTAGKASKFMTTTFFQLDILAGVSSQLKASNKIASHIQTNLQVLAAWLILRTADTVISNKDVKEWVSDPRTIWCMVINGYTVYYEHFIPLNSSGIHSNPNHNFNRFKFLLFVPSFNSFRFSAFQINLTQIQCLFAKICYRDTW